MENLIQELVPYAKGFAAIYLIGNVVGTILTIIVFICTFRYILKKIRKFDEEFKSRWR